MAQANGRKVGVLGSGTVGRTLANGLREYGYEPTIGSRDGKQVEGWDGAVGTFADAAAGADLAILAVKGTVAEDLVRRLAPHLAGKTVMDTTNPIAEAPPEGGVLRFFTDLNGSLMERLQGAAPEAHFVKAFSSVGAASMVNPDFDTRPSMFICGDDATSKQVVSALVESFGWETEDLGGAVAARAIEPLAMLWCIPGMTRNEWTHAFKVLHR
jgi:predicted dinucleotide-binding enzyme